MEDYSTDIIEEAPSVEEVPSDDFNNENFVENFSPVEEVPSYEYVENLPFDSIESVETSELIETYITDENGSTITTLSVEQNIELIKNGVLSISSIFIFFLIVGVSIIIFKILNWFF